MSDKAVVLLSGGLDSATTLALAIESGFACHCLCFDYGQRHLAELKAAERVAASLGASELRRFQIDLAQFGGSALTDPTIAVPVAGNSNGIPLTYVPARNTILLSMALAFAETIAAKAIFIGINAVDYSGYPDCRPEYLAAFQRMADLATKVGVDGQGIRIHAPLLQMSKSDIIAQGVRLGIDYGKTVSCYQADTAGRACGNCDACHLRRDGFLAAGIADPTQYR